jgi:tetratricopeptide (TPR) repeat protein
LVVCAGLFWSRSRSHKALVDTQLAAGQSNTTSTATQSSTQTLQTAKTVPVLPPQEQVAKLKREAVAVAEQVAAAYPNDPLTYALLGSAFYNTGQSEEAIKHLKKCLELRPNQADAYEILARIAYEKGEPEETARLSQEALKHGPASPDVLNRLGQALMDSGRTEEAIRALQQAVRLPQPISESWHLLGQAQMQAGEYAQAKESFRKAVALVPDHTQAFFGLYTACMRLEQTEEAGRYREQFVKLEAIDRQSLSDRSAQEDTRSGLPLVRATVARTVFGAAQIYRLHEQNDKAAELFRKAAALDADSPAYRSALESFYLQHKNPAEGVMVFQQLIAEQPQNPLNYMFVGRLQSRLENFEEAERSLRKVQELAPEWMEGYRALAELYLRANRKGDQAILLTRKMVQLEPSGPNYYLMAVALARNNDPQGALDAVKQAIARSPGEPKYEELLRRLQQAP